MAEQHFLNPESRPTAVGGRAVEQRVSTSWSAAEQRRVVELLCTGLERRLKQRGCVDFSSHLSVDADAREEDDRWER